MFKIIMIGFVAFLLSSSMVYMLISTNMNFSEMKTASMKKMTKSIVDDLDAAMPLIQKAGYDLDAIEATFTLPPEVKTIFILKKIVEKKKQEMILKALEHNAIGKLTLNALINGFALNDVMSIKSMKLKLIHITITLPPSVTLEYEKNDD